MRQHFLVLSQSDWNRPISLCPSTDQIVSEETALAMAEEAGKEEVTYVYRLHTVRRPATKDQIDEILCAPSDAQSLNERVLQKHDIALRALADMDFIEQWMLDEAHRYGGTD